jgi:hypothetical protein
MRHRQLKFDKRTGFAELATLLERDGDRKGLYTKDADPQRAFPVRATERHRGWSSRQREMVGIEIGLEASAESLGLGRLSVPSLSLGLGGFVVETT